MRAANHSSLIRSFLIDSVPPQARCGKFLKNFFTVPIAAIGMPLSRKRDEAYAVLLAEAI
jgi:hypothetical protein